MLRKFLLSTLLCLLAVPAYGATVSLDLQVNTVAKTFDVYASILGASDGLEGFAVDVVCAGGVSVLTSLNKSPRPFDVGLDDFTGFSQFRTNGTLGIDVHAGQNIAGGSPYLLFDLGVTAPVYLASGTYTGNVGSLTARLTPGSFFNLFPDNYVSGGPAPTTTAVSPETVTVPEPATWLMAASGLVMLGCWRRRAKRSV